LWAVIVGASKGVYAISDRAGSRRTLEDFDELKLKKKNHLLLTKKLKILIVNINSFIFTTFSWKLVVNFVDHQNVSQKKTRKQYDKKSSSYL
jgi:hypothetical protein